MGSTVGLDVGLVGATVGELVGFLVGVEACKPLRPANSLSVIGS